MEVMTISDDEILSAIRSCHQDNEGYVICPHTATGLAAALKYVLLYFSDRKVFNSGHDGTQ